MSDRILDRLKQNRYVIKELWTKYFTIRRWWHITWYLYLFEKPFNITKLRCRYKGHPNGEIHFNPNGLEPDHRCKDCYDDLG